MSAPLSLAQFPDHEQTDTRKKHRSTVVNPGYPQVAFVGYGVGYVGVGGGYGGGAMTTTGTSGGEEANETAAQEAAEQAGGDADGGTAGAGDAGAGSAAPSS